MAKKKKKKVHLKTREEKQAQHRRNLLSKLKPEAREFAAAEFAKLGLYQ